MIGLAAFLLMRAPLAPPVYEYVDGTASEISIQAIASLPRLTARQAASLDALVDEIPREVEGYSRRDILDTTSGDTIHCVAGPDYVRISFSVPPENWRAGMSLMEALVQRSRLTASESSRLPQPSAWTVALRPYVGTANPRPADVRELYQTLFRKENLTLAVGGAITPGQMTDDWLKRTGHWPVVRVSPSLGIEPLPKPLEKNPGGLSSIEITGPTFGPNDAALSTRTLALIALGAGKGASLFRIGRQKMALSYRQEAMLYPVPEGWESRLIQVMKPIPDLAARAEALRAALLEDVQGWTEADRLRALGMADGIFTRGVPFSPFAFGPTGPVDGSLESRTFLQAYWQLKTGNAWDAPSFLQQMRTVTLEDLKDSASEVLAKGRVRILPGE